MHTDEEQRLIEKLRKIEGLFARPSTPGERVAAENAAERIRQRIRHLEGVERAIEFRFSLPDTWSRSLFVALLRRYGLEPYRYRGQRRTTVMTRVTRTFAVEVLWPEFQQLNQTLRDHLESVTHRVIRQAIHGDDAEAHERQGDEPRMASQGQVLDEHDMRRDAR
jgi:hypothetical protein